MYDVSARVTSKNKSAIPIVANVCAGLKAGLVGKVNQKYVKMHLIWQLSALCPLLRKQSGKERK